jgi:hypothetical protein
MAGPCSSVSIPNNIQTLRNITVTAPIQTSDLTGLEVYSFDFNLTYDSAVLTAPVVSNTGTISSSMIITVNDLTPGLLRVSGYGDTALAGSGSLLNLSFTASGPIGSVSPLDFSVFAYNEGTPCSTTANGQITIVSGSIAGSVTYANAASPPKPVPYVTVNASGSVNTSTSTDLAGLYSFAGFGPGAYTITPSKTGDVNGITAFDSALIAQQVIALITFTPTQILAADVSQNGAVTSFDAALIAQYVIAIPNIGNTGSWKFLPQNRTYPNIEANFVAQDYGAILMGEVSGNWVPPTMRPAPETEDADSGAVPVLLDRVVDPSNAKGELLVPIVVGETTAAQIVSYQFELAYDPLTLRPLPDCADSAGTISNGMAVFCNATAPGVIKVVAFGAIARKGRGALLNLRFEVTGPGTANTALVWKHFMFNEGTPAARTGDEPFSVAER